MEPREMLVRDAFSEPGGRRAFQEKFCVIWVLQISMCTGYHGLASTCFPASSPSLQREHISQDSLPKSSLLTSVPWCVQVCLKWVSHWVITIFAQITDKVVIKSTDSGVWLLRSESQLWHLLAVGQPLKIFVLGILNCKRRIHHYLIHKVIPRVKWHSLCKMLRTVLKTD